MDDREPATPDEIVTMLDAAQAAMNRRSGSAGSRGAGKSHPLLLITEELAGLSHGDTNSMQTTLAMIGASRAALMREELDAFVRFGVIPELQRRLTPPITGDMVEAHLAELVQVRDLVVPLLDDGEVTDAVAGDPRGEGYRLHVYLARRSARHEVTRRALLWYELALTNLYRGDNRGVALLAKARSALTA